MPDDNASQVATAPGAAFEAFLKAGEFRLQHCSACRRQIYFPRTVCNYCGSDNLQWLPASGRGIVYSTTVVRQRPDRGGDYNVAIIELLEGAASFEPCRGCVTAGCSHRYARRRVHRRCRRDTAVAVPRIDGSVRDG